MLNAKDDRFPEFGKTYREIREHLEFTLEQYSELKIYAESKGLDFMVTAFDTVAVDFLEELGCPAYKIASFEAVDLALVRKAALTGKPVIVSTGMVTVEEIEHIKENARDYVENFKKYKK